MNSILGRSIPSSRLNKILQFFSAYQIHFIAWAIFIGFEISILFASGSTNHTLVSYITFYSLNISLFYIHATVLSWLLNQPEKKIVLISTYLIFEIVIYNFLILGLEISLNYFDLLVKIPEPRVKINLKNILSTTWRCTYFIFYATAYCFLKRYLSERTERLKAEKQRFKLRLDRETLEKDLSRSKQEYFKTQINPDLIFNTLGILQRDIARSSPEDATIVSYLSKLMQFVSSDEIQKGDVAIHKEIEHCLLLIALHKTILGNIHLNINHSEELADLHILPCLLISALENMFKHGDLSDARIPGQLNIHLDGNDLFIQSVNQFNSVKKRSGLNSGLLNLKKRLEYTYGSSATLNTRYSDFLFMLEIRIDRRLLKNKKYNSANQNRVNDASN